MGNAQALPWSNNWACSAIREKIRDAKPDATKIAIALAMEDRFLAVIQEVIDMRNDPNYDPDMPDGDPAQAVIGRLSSELVATN